MITVSTRTRDLDVVALGSKALTSDQLVNV